MGQNLIACDRAHVLLLPPSSIAGTILVSNLVCGNGTDVAAMIFLAAVAIAGFGIATRLPANPVQAGLAPAATRGTLETAA